MYIETSVVKIDRKHLIISVGILIIFTVWQLYTAYFQQDRLSSDQYNLGIMIFKDLDSNLYQGDYLFRNDEFYQYYTPFYRYLFTKFISPEKNYSYVLLQFFPFVMVIYLIGFFLLLLWLTQNPWISAGLAIISSLSWQSAGGEYWGVSELWLILPRAFYSALSPWLVWMMLGLLLGQSRSFWFPLAFFVGVSANLHPISAMSLTQILFVVFFIKHGISIKHLLILLGLAVTILLGAFPLALNFFSSTVAHTSQLQFDVFHEVMRMRLQGVFSTVINEFSILGWNLSVSVRQFLVWIYIVGTIGCSASLIFFNRKKFPSLVKPYRLYSFLMLLQVPVLLAITSDKAVGLILWATVYIFIKIYRQKFDVLDKWLLILLSLTTFLAFAGSYIIEALWANTQLLLLTPFVGEQLRTSRFVYVWLFALLAIFLQFVWSVTPTKEYKVIGVGLGIGYVSVASHSLFWCGLYVGLVLLWVLAWFNLHLYWSILAEFLMWLLCIRLFLFFVSGNIRAGLWLASGLTIGIMWIRFGSSVFDIKKPFVLISGICLSYVIILSGTLFFPSNVVTTWREVMIQTPHHMKQILTFESVRTRSFTELADWELYDWVRSNTPKDSLFFHNSLAFRYWAQRGLTHNWKDIATVYYAKTRMVEIYNRYQKFEAAYYDSDTLLDLAHSENVNYIIITSQQSLHLSLPVVFKNQKYTVYQLNKNDDPL